jgi:hypothetical protein
MPVLLQTARLLSVSNVFMMFAWYAHLKNQTDRKWYIAAVVSWSVALFWQQVMCARAMFPFLRALLAFFKAFPLFLTASSSEARVFVFGEIHFPRSGGAATISARKITSELAQKRHGSTRSRRSRGLTAVSLNKPKTGTSQRRIYISC